VKWYIVLTGSFNILQGKRLEPGDTFGSLEPSKTWLQGDVVAMEESSVGVLEPNKVLSIIKEETETKSCKELLNFLTESIHYFNQASGSLKYKLSKLFVEKTFMVNSKIIKNGEFISSVYLIKKGLCKVMSIENPLDRIQDDELEIDNLQFGSVQMKKKRKRGFVSRSISRYQIKVVGPKEWLGEEILFEDLAWKEAEYSVIAIVTTTVLCISKENLNKFPSNVLQHIKQNAYEKLRWNVIRRNDLLQSIKRISKLNSLTEESNSVVKKREVKVFKAKEVSGSFITEIDGSREESLCKKNKIFPLDPKYISLLKRSRDWTKRRKGQVKSFFINDNQDTSLKKQWLSNAATVKTFYKYKALRPIILIKTPITRKVAAKSEDKEPKKIIGLTQNNFMVGIKQISIVDTNKPPSPNLARIC